MNATDREIIDHFLHTREKTIELLRGIPDGLLNRTPAGETASVAVQFFHIAVSSEWFMDTVMGDGGGETRQVPGDREGITELLERTGKRPSAFFEPDGDRMDREFTAVIGDGREHTCTGRDWLLTTIDHEVHHRGKIVLALRQWGFGDFPHFLYT